MTGIVDKYRTTNNIVLAGWQDADAIYNIFLASDLAVFPGTHSVLWEQAASCGLPIVAQHWGGMEHININGNAMLVDSLNVSIINQIVNALFNSQEYKVMKAKAQSVSSTFYLRNIANYAIGR